MNKKEYVLGLVITLALFTVFVYFFLEPKFGPQVSYEDKKVKTEEQKNLGEEQQESIIVDEKDTPTVGNPDYGDLTSEQIAIVDKSIENLLSSEKRDNLIPSDIKVTNFEEREFSDASLGCPKKGEVYAQVVTAGYQIILEAKESNFDFRMSKSSEIPILCSEL